MAFEFDTKVRQDPKAHVQSRAQPYVTVPSNEGPEMLCAHMHTYMLAYTDTCMHPYFPIYHKHDTYTVDIDSHTHDPAGPEGRDLTQSQDNI